MLAFEPVTVSVGMWLLSKPQLIVRPKRLMVFARREVIKSALIGLTKVSPDQAF
jgi:hypothetical protein